MSSDIDTMMIGDDRLQLEQAAKGCVSGNLSEWPALNLAFRHAGFYLFPEQTFAPQMRELSQMILACGQIRDALADAVRAAHPEPKGG